ncbi:hypothetical protein WMY93_008607 [Mugilogobius chulae]|uniref:Ig-like domain-containing protein n=1 Tax=Mugilogobius chulae TaxID=88201 RepID=A0AAW0PJH3_9GOBI
MPRLHFILRLLITGGLSIYCWAWRVDMPRHIVALKGSCLTIPCSFDYYQNPPVRPNRVVWYQYQSRGYPLVYDDWHSKSVIDIFRGRTRVSTYGRSCTLEIYPVSYSHHRQKLYPWVDPENVGKGTYAFYDTTVTLEVVEGGPVCEGPVQCRHTCKSQPPTLSLNIPLKEHSLYHSTSTDGKTKTILTTVMFVERDQQTVQCSFTPLSITPTTEEFLEGVSTQVRCTASYTCAQNIPTLTWNYGNMVTSTHTVSSGKAQWTTTSTVKFISAARDHGKYLTCYARNMMSRGWSFSAPSSVTGMAGSCIVIPCSFTYTQSRPANPKVIWYLYQSKGYSPVYDSTQGVVSKYRSRTSLFGSVNEGNCSLKIEGLKKSHSQDKVYPWVDKDPITSFHTIGHSFYDKTTQIIVSDHAKEPELSVIGMVRVGAQSRVSCSVQHSYSTRHTMLSDVAWEQKVERVWTVSEDDQRVRCTVSYPGGQKATSEIELNAECPIAPLSITNTTEEFLEGVSTNVICTASYTCARNKPTLSWNYGNMVTTTQTTRSGNAQWTTTSTMKFISAATDNGKFLTCYAHFTGAQMRKDASIPLRVKRNMMSRGWSFSAPSSVTGMAGSCVVIPCSFTYTQSRPANPKVIWYLYQSKGYSPVYDSTQGVVSKYRSRTSLFGSVNEGNCSLKIEGLEKSHSQDKVYPWVDKDPITSFHTIGHSFYDKTTQIIVSDHAKEPELSIIGVVRVGAQSRVSCSVQHSCISAPPRLTLSGSLDKTALDTQCCLMWLGAESRASLDCPYEDITMIEKPGNLTEGMAKYVACSVTYKCKKNLPDIVWNFGNMQNQIETKKMSKDTYQTVSNLTFIGSLSDDRKALTCTAVFKDGETSDSVALQITILQADVPFRVSALSRSCVVIPCTYENPQDLLLTRGIWTKQGDMNSYVYHNGRSEILDHFKDRTRLLGDLHNGDCSLEINDIKPFDNGPFCFIAQKGDTGYRFNNSCAFVLMKASPDKPVMTKIVPEADAGSVARVSCSVTHTCSTHPPKFAWSIAPLTNEVTQTALSRSVWETTSNISFTVPAGDGLQNVTCTAIFWRDKQESEIGHFIVKGSLVHQMLRSAPIVAPVTSFALVAVIIAVVLGFIFYKNRRKAEDSQGPPPRPEKRRSLFERLNRNKEAGERPPRPEKRRSFWQRLSSRREEGVYRGKRENQITVLLQTHSHENHAALRPRMSAEVRDNSGETASCK